MNIRRFAVSRRSFGLLQHVMRDAPAVTGEIGEIHRLAGLVVGERIDAVLIGGALANQVGGSVGIVAARLVQFEVRSGHAVALLVEFDQVVFGNVGEIVHPYVIVALEVEGHRLVVDDAVDRLHELRLGMHAEVMVQHGVPRRNLVRQRPVGVLEHVFGRVEGEKLTNGAAPFRPHTRSIVQGHGI